jgi:hypothetical protein
MTAPVRHYCRNSRCRMKLAVPVDNERRAFCTPACHASFYRHRCIVCEKELPPGPANRKLCKSAKCRREYRRFPHVYHLAGNVQRPLETPIKSSLATRPIAERASTTALRFSGLPRDPARAARVARDNAKGKKNPLALFQPAPHATAQPDWRPPLRRRAEAQGRPAASHRRDRADAHTGAS